MTVAAASRASVVPALLAGAALGLLYTLSPLTVLLVPLLVGAIWWIARDLPARERRWVVALLAIAIVVRVAVIAGLFVSADPAQPYATFFGDEELFKSRSLWLRNIGLGVPISTADFIYAVDEMGKSYYLFLLAYIDALVGPTPYGIHVLNTGLYLVGVTLLYRCVRRSYGGVVAFGGLVVLLWLPSLFIWSISALKEPLYTLLAVCELLCVMQVVRARGWHRRVLSAVAVVAIAFLLEGLRKGGILVAAIGGLGGLAAGLTLAKPRLTLAAMVAAPVACVALLWIPFAQERLLSVARQSAIYHVGHIFTAGYSYRTLDAWYYIDPADIHRMPAGDAAAFVVRSLVGFFTQPLPWTIESRAMLAYLPEYVAWLVLASLAPLGIVAGLRRDAQLTCVLAAHSGAIVLMVALTSGNIGTLIRHRGLVLPYLVWLSALGAWQILAWAVPANPVSAGDSDHAHR